MSLYTVIVTYNAMKWIHSCLDSLLGSVVPTQIIVVDNASSDGTLEEIKKHYSQVTCIAQSENIGFGAANNIGIQHVFSQCTPENPPEAIFLLNQDAKIEPNTLSVLLKSLKANPEFGILSPIHFNGTGTDLDRPFRNYLLESGIEPEMVMGYGLSVMGYGSDELSHGSGVEGYESDGLSYGSGVEGYESGVMGYESGVMGSGSGELSYGSEGLDTTHSPLPTPHSPIPIRFVNAAAWMLNPACIQKTGGFHPVFFMYGEDWELLNRVEHAGFKVGLVPQVSMFHDRELRPPKPSDQRELDFFEVKSLVSKLHPGLNMWDRFKIIVHELFMTFSARFFSNPVASIRFLWRKLVILSSLGKRIREAGPPPDFRYH